ncbi:baseplate hub assembly protein [Salmonella phage vB_SnwM_CGG4-1]|uniref:Baseplate hub assembly protein n=1 Tax=Salmonella phage vB_SnwM_CGG4-1 TaxID=1815631 RepID=A0A1B0VVM6_9CAUD|nr:baseplate hub assembly protein [Salmonella phage vB_SnwM_CGG4-1]ANA49533.1 baseplate hub assembly protein [Salmonella phage vB_SnwM_CGG4-1]
MANIIRCVLPDGVHRFKPFTVADYRDFLLVRNDLLNKSSDEQTNILNELLNDYFHEFPETWRPHIFLKVFTGSIGKTKIPIAFSCPICGKKKQTLFDLSLDDLKSPEVEVAGIKIYFNFPNKFYADKAQQINDNIRSILYNGTEILWENLSDEDKLQVIDAIDIDTLEKIISQMTPMSLTLKMKCCKTTTIKYEDFLNIFCLLLNPDEVFSFYQINHMLVKNQYDMNSIMNMIPVERSIALSLVEKDNKQ